ncbi:cobalamin biosynthesis protein CobD [Psychromonas sp. psych-6C06]|uniref:adenosylcobinamide-phosphate synthase CbiB n=1 Tax=Psychromonas sp. psych-6C06 TaxID=2058089 RepID=UPI000C3498C1|nr:adenosylcobinamide-phosphate synthase CbiB [Psychromonas sp. psych-6C06]PKF61606.1 cobalamin biosynthesis protein CobD [Psychromonas sp. psych-6C06]
MILITLLCALLIDHLLGEPRRFHPLIFFGNLARKLEKRLNQGSHRKRLLMGIAAWLILVIPIPLLVVAVLSFVPFYIAFLINVYVVYWAVALKSLTEHGMQIYQPLTDNNLSQAQHYCAYIVSRDTSELDAQAISRATTESMLENGHDGVTATLIYFVIGGAPLVIMHRLSNTLDAMWGYRTAQFNYFGKCSARMDDLLGFISAKVTTLLFAIVGLFNGTAKMALFNAYQQSKTYKSHNGGWVMAAGATVINVCLGGTAIYFGKSVQSPQLGQGEAVQSKHIKMSLTLVRQAVCVGLIILFFLQWILF